MEKIKNFPVPTDTTGMRCFLGLASYYRRFVPNFATIAAPLNQLIKKDAVFEWTEACQELFDQLKCALVSAPVLVYPKLGPGNSFILETDASNVRLGAVLSQMQDDGTIHSVAYASRSVDKHEKNYGILELETIGLVWSARYFHKYILGHPCTVYTDHAACLSILNTARPSRKLARWALTIQEMDLMIKHKAGIQNGNADALSRCPISKISASQDEARQEAGCDSSVNAVTVNECSSIVPDKEEVLKLQTADEDISAILAYRTRVLLGVFRL